MPDYPEGATTPERLAPVTFRGVNKLLPPPQRRPTPSSETSEPRPISQPPEQQPPPPSPPKITLKEKGPSAAGTRVHKGAAGERAPVGVRSRVGTGQLPARLPIDLARWVNASEDTQRAVLLTAFVEHGEDVAPSRDPVYLSRSRLGLSVQPTKKRRGVTELMNFSMTGEEKDLISARAAELGLSVVDLVTEVLTRARATSEDLS